jgi:hypothetical protein
MTLKRLSSGYWHARWTSNLWMQWPVYGTPVADSRFGMLTGAQEKEALDAALRIERGEEGEAK